LQTTWEHSAFSITGVLKHSDVNVFSVQLRRNAFTNADGMVALTHFPDKRLTDITIDFSAIVVVDNSSTE
ncbi:MAG: hypothetical protein QMA97_06860, partial [Glaciecola sp.]